jgi:hypothetical protein
MNEGKHTLWESRYMILLYFIILRRPSPPPQIRTLILTKLVITVEQSSAIFVPGVSSTCMSYVFYVSICYCWNRDSEVSIATGYGLDDQGVRVSSPAGLKNFQFTMLSRSALRSTQSPIQWVLGALSPGVKRPGREADHSPPASAEVKKMWVYTSTPPYVFMA